MGVRKALSHDVDKELAGVAHSMLEGLATGGELGGHGRQLPPGGGPGGRAAADRGLGGRQSGQTVRRGQARGSVGGGVAPLAVGAGARAGLGEGGVAVGEGRLAVVREGVAPVRLAVVAEGGAGVAVVAHLAGRAVAAPPPAGPLLGFAAR